jgi:oxalate decarboxylase
MDPLSRRGVLAFSAAGAVAAAASTAKAAAFGNPDAPPQGAVNANAGSFRDPGPQNPALTSQFPSSVNRPATDVGDMPQFWASFNVAILYQGRGTHDGVRCRSACSDDGLPGRRRRSREA